MLVLLLDWARLAEQKDFTEGRKDLKESDRPESDTKARPLFVLLAWKIDDFGEEVHAASFVSCWTSAFRAASKAVKILRPLKVSW